MSKPDRSELDGRMKWALKMQEKFAIHIYKKYWAINKTEITEVDSHAETEKAAQKIDASGIDKIVEPETGVRHVAQRFRTLTNKNGRILEPDFSIRTSTYSDKDTEYDKLLKAYRNNGNIPKIYTFGVGAAVKKKDCLQKGFKDFYFLDLHGFLKLFDRDHIEAVASYPNGDGRKALYFDIQDLRDTVIVQNEISGNVLASSWNQGDASDDFPTAPGIKSTGQLNLLGFGGDD